MSWYKVTFDKKTIKNQNIQADFSALMALTISDILAKNKAIALFASVKKDEKGNPVEGTYYFSPECASHFPDFLKIINAEICEEPPMENLGRVANNPKAKELL